MLGTLRLSVGISANRRPRGCVNVGLLGVWLRPDHSALPPWNIDHLDAGALAPDTRVALGKVVRILLIMRIAEETDCWLRLILGSRLSWSCVCPGISFFLWLWSVSPIRASLATHAKQAPFLL